MTGYFGVRTPSGVVQIYVEDAPIAGDFIRFNGLMQRIVRRTFEHGYDRPSLGPKYICVLDLAPIDDGDPT